MHGNVAKEKDLSLWQVFICLLIYFLHLEGRGEGGAVYKVFVQRVGGIRHPIIAVFP